MLLFACCSILFFLYCCADQGRSTTSPARRESSPGSPVTASARTAGRPPRRRAKPTGTSRARECARTAAAVRISHARTHARTLYYYYAYRVVRMMRMMIYDYFLLLDFIFCTHDTCVLYNDHRQSWSHDRRLFVVQRLIVHRLQFTRSPNELQEASRLLHKPKVGKAIRATCPETCGMCSWHWLVREC